MQDINYCNFFSIEKIIYNLTHTYIYNLRNKNKIDYKEQSPDDATTVYKVIYLLLVLKVMQLFSQIRYFSLKFCLKILFHMLTQKETHSYCQI